MEPLKLDELLEATNGVVQEYATGSIDRENWFNGISTDTRTLNKGDLFFSLKGPRFNGDDFIKDALSKGANGIVCDGKRPLDKGLMINVADTTKALGDLAKYYRKKMPAKIIAVTGSNGKTTTKDMIYHLLSKKFDVVKSKNSFNNFIGVPLTIFDINKCHKFGVVEMGTNAFGEIRRLSEIGSPDVAVITNIAETHFQGLKSVTGVQKAKAEILDNINDQGVLLINSDDEFALEIGKGFKGEFIDYGFNRNAKISASNIKRNGIGWSFIVNDKHKVNLPVPGYYNIFNCLAAYAVGHSLGFDFSDIDSAFDDFKLSPMRMDKETITITGNGRNHLSNGKLSNNMSAEITVINDAYNANPSSMRAVIRDYGMSHTNGRKIFISGDMAELGDESERLHFDIGEEIGVSGIDVLWTVGEYANSVSDGAVGSGMSKDNILSFVNLQDLLNFAIITLKNNDTILIKGSRSMKLENVIDGIKQHFNQ